MGSQVKKKMTHSFSLAWTSISTRFCTSSSRFFRMASPTRLSSSSSWNGPVAMAGEEPLRLGAEGRKLSFREPEKPTEDERAVELFESLRMRPPKLMGWRSGISPVCLGGGDGVGTPVELMSVCGNGSLDNASPDCFRTHESLIGEWIGSAVAWANDKVGTDFALCRYSDTAGRRNFRSAEYPTQRKKK